MIRAVLALLLATQLGCATLMNRVPERAVRPGDRFACETSYAPAVVDLGITALLVAAPLIPDDCGPEGCHSSEQAVQIVAALYLGIPFFLSSLWGAYASTTCRAAYDRARVQSPDAPPSAAGDPRGFVLR